MKKSSKILGLLLAAGMFITGCDKSKPVVNPNDDGKTNEQGGEEQQQHQHSFGEWKVTKSASCKEAGEKERKCSGCDEVEKEVIPQLTEHSFGEWNETPATCAEDGVKERTCSVCGAKETEDLPKLTTHDFGEWETTKPNSCKEAGEKERTCSVCGAKETEEIPISDVHTYRNWAYNVESGNVQRTCKVCDHIDVAPAGEAPEKTWTDDEKAIFDNYFFGANVPYMEFDDEYELEYSAQQGYALKNGFNCTGEKLAEYVATFPENWTVGGSEEGADALYYRLEGRIETAEGVRYPVIIMYGLTQGENGYEMTADGSGIFVMEVRSPYAYSFDKTMANTVAVAVYGTQYVIPDPECDYYEYDISGYRQGSIEVYGLTETEAVADVFWAFIDALEEAGYYDTGEKGTKFGGKIYASEDYRVGIEVTGLRLPEYGIIALCIMAYPGIPEVNGDELNATSVAIDPGAEGYNSYAFTGTSTAEYLVVASADGGFAINGAEGHGIVVTKSVGTVNAVKIIFKDNTAKDVVVVVYGSNEPFDIADMADEDTAAEKGLTELGILAVDKDFTTQLNFETEYAYVGFVVVGGAAFIDQLIVAWTIPQSGNEGGEGGEGGSEGSEGQGGSEGSEGGEGSEGNE